MMTAYIPAGRSVPKIAVQIAPQVWRYRSTGTRDKHTVKRMQLMVHELHTFRADAWSPEGAWALLGKLAQQKGAHHPDAWSLADLYARYQQHRGDVGALSLDLGDELLADLFAAFETHVAAKRSPDTAAHYRVYLDTLAGAEITRLSHLTAPALERWVDGLAEVDDDGWARATGTRRKYAAGVSAFCSWLVRHGKRPTNAMRDVPKPARGASRLQWLAEPQMRALADAQASPFRELSAFIHGTGLDVTVACERIEAGQIDQVSWSCTSVRPKTGRRHTVVIAEWARPYVRRLLRGKLPRAVLGEGVTRWALSDSHRAACAALAIEHYWLRDARHSWAVRFDAMGGTPAQGAEQLGHADGGVLFTSLYAQRAQSIKERVELERQAAR